jgi:EAL domain-containing protein (putative c-di-GMP-specific phosphodiesterase class I)
VSIYPGDGLDAETLIKNADIAMYQAKENGHRDFKFFRQAMNVRVVERHSIEESLRNAVKRQEFELHYLPKIDLRTGAITGAEALLRWTHPTRGVVAPAEFLPIASDCGMILPIGQWVLREACKQARGWLDEGLPPITMAVNISGNEFRDGNFLHRVIAILQETGLESKFLQLELTESVLMKRADSALSVLQAIKAHGVQVALDDFGTGYSSLSYLTRFPIDALKIDQSFIRKAISTSETAAIVTAVIRIGRSLKLRVIAEGVETHEEVTFLKSHECDEAQGMYFSQSLPAKQFVELLQTGIAATCLH